METNQKRKSTMGDQIEITINGTDKNAVLGTARFLQKVLQSNGVSAGIDFTNTQPHDSYIPYSV